MMSKTNENYKSTVSLSGAFGALIALCLVAALIAGTVIYAANDVYAFVKPDMVVTINIPSPINAKQLSVLLCESGVINDDIIFLLYLQHKGKADMVSHLMGEWTFNSNMSYRDILQIFF